jgi:hypothetical protein
MARGLVRQAGESRRVDDEAERGVVWLHARPRHVVHSAPNLVPI